MAKFRYEVTYTIPEGFQCIAAVEASSQHEAGAIILGIHPNCTLNKIRCFGLLYPLTPGLNIIKSDGNNLIKVDFKNRRRV